MTEYERLIEMNLKPIYPKSGFQFHRTYKKVDDNAPANHIRVKDDFGQKRVVHINDFDIVYGDKK